MTGATLAAVDVFLAYISVVIFFLSVSLGSVRLAAKCISDDEL